jgi:hypothetical protein
MSVRGIHYTNPDRDMIHLFPVRSGDASAGSERDVSAIGHTPKSWALSAAGRIAKCAQCGFGGWPRQTNSKCTASISFVLAMGVYLGTAQAEPLPRDIPTPAPVLPLTAGTAGEFAKDCVNNDMSCADVIGMTLTDKINFARTIPICLPGTDYAHGVVRWLNAHPETASMSTEDGIFLALKTVYACGGPNDH